VTGPAIALSLPPWLPGFIRERGPSFPGALDRMALLVALAGENVRRGTGGPFAAGVFEAQGGRLAAAGVNVVLPSRCSLAHAEVMALGGAQRRLGTHDLGAARFPSLVLATSVEPCAMCLGALVWSGVRLLECGARGEDAGAAGFDEGPKPERWEEELRRRGISVTRDVLREEAAAVLRGYATGGGVIYNPSR
jgi:tRNA(Arg) A34 adenosine deaminase TadA